MPSSFYELLLQVIINKTWERDRIEMVPANLILGVFSQRSAFFDVKVVSLYNFLFKKLLFKTHA